MRRRDVHLGPVAILDGQEVLGLAVLPQGLDAQVPADAVDQVDHVIVHLQFQERVDGARLQPLRHGTSHLVPLEELTVADGDRGGIDQAESLVQGAEAGLEVAAHGLGHLADQFVQPLTFALVVAEDPDAVLAGQLDQLVSDAIDLAAESLDGLDAEGEPGVLLARGGEAPQVEPREGRPLAHEAVVLVDADGRGQPRDEAAAEFGHLERVLPDGQRGLGQIVEQVARGLGLDGALRQERDGHLARLADALLGGGVERADALDRVAEELDAVGHGGRGGVDVQNAAAHAELASLADEVGRLEAALDEPGPELLGVAFVADPQEQGVVVEVSRAGHGLEQGLNRRDDDQRRAFVGRAGRGAQGLELLE